MKPTLTALVFSIAVLGHCDGQNSTTTTSCTSTNNGTSPASASSPTPVVLDSHSFEPTPHGNSTALTLAAAAADAASAAPSSTPNGTVSLPVPVDNSLRGEIEDEFSGEIAEDDDGNPLPIRFGLEGLQTLLVDLPWAMWRWPRLPSFLYPPKTAPVSEFTKTECTRDTIDPYEERRASQNLEKFCNRWQINHERLYASTAGRTTLYMCPYGEMSNCNLDLWRAASAHLDKACGENATGYVHLRKMRIGRESTTKNAVLCDDLMWSPLRYYYIGQRERTVGGRPYEVWRKENNRKGVEEEGKVKNIEEGNDAEP